MSAQPPLVVHVIHHLAMGGMENGLVNLINRMPAERYRHAIVCAEDSTEFRERIVRPGVEVVELHKSQLSTLQLWKAFHRTFKQLRPDIVHTRNMSGLDALLPACLAGVPVRIHGEHGRDVSDPHGKNLKFRLIRRLHKPMVTRYIALSQELADYLLDAIGVPTAKVIQICNGVDVERFKICAQKPAGILPAGWDDPRVCVIGTVGRAQAVKDQASLLRAFAALLEQTPSLRSSLRLAIVGDGPLFQPLQQLALALNIADLVWLPGAREDVPQVLQCFDVFALPSLAEGISNSILEAMACGLPVVATVVGGNAQLVAAGESGVLIPPGRVELLAEALKNYVGNVELRRQHGAASRKRIDRYFSLDAMVGAYANLYDACRK